MEGLGAPYAVINGLVVGIGEQLGDVTVVKIGDGRVTVRRLDGTQEDNRGRCEDGAEELTLNRRLVRA